MSDLSIGNGVLHNVHTACMRIFGQRIWKLVKALGRRVGVPELHPHASRHGCGVELHRRTGGNLRAVQGYLRHTDIQTTTVHTLLTAEDLAEFVRVFDQAGHEKENSKPVPEGRKLWSRRRLWNQGGGSKELRPSLGEALRSQIQGVARAA